MFSLCLSVANHITFKTLWLHKLNTGFCICLDQPFGQKKKKWAKERHKHHHEHYSVLAWNSRRAWDWLNAHAWVALVQLSQHVIWMELKVHQWNRNRFANVNAENMDNIFSLTYNIRCNLFLIVLFMSLSYFALINFKKHIFFSSAILKRLWNCQHLSLLEQNFRFLLNK